MAWWFAKPKAQQAQPTWLQRYLAAKPGKGALLKQPIRAASFLVFDTETSGFTIKKDHILSIGAITVRDNVILLDEALEVLAAAPETEKTEHVEIHEILPKHSLDAGALADALAQFVELATGKILVGHHVHYDISMVSQKMKDLYGVKLYNPYVDTGQLAIRLEHPPSHAAPVVGKNYTLDALCERYRISPDDRHNAAGDAFITAQLLLKLIHKAEVRGAKTVADLMETKSGGLL